MTTTEPDKADAFVTAAQQIIDAANQPPVDPATKAASLVDVLGHVAAAYGTSNVATAAAKQKPPAGGTSHSPPSYPGAPCPPGHTDPTLSTLISALSRVTDPSQAFFPTGETGKIETFLLNIAADLAALVSIFGNVGSIQARELINGFQATRPTTPLTPEAAADMVERNILPLGVAQEEALAAGVSHDRFQAMIDDAGEPPGIMEMLTLWRRGLITDEHLKQAIAYSRVKTEYFCDLLNLAYAPLSPADAVEARLKGVVPDDATAKKMFAAGGGLVDDYEIALATAGNAIGVEQAATLYNHGLIQRSDFQKVILHSRINPEFEPMAELLRHRWLSPFQIHQALQAGTVTKDQATTWLEEDGYSPEQALAFASVAPAAKPAKHKEETEAQILELYETGFLNHDDAFHALNNLGYSDNIIDYLLDLRDAQRMIAETNQAINKVHAAYLARRIFANEAHQELLKLGVATPAITKLLTAWQVELDTTYKELSMAQIGHLVKNGFITTTDACQRWTNMGYAAEGASLLLAIYTGVPPPGSPAALKAKK